MWRWRVCRRYSFNWRVLKSGVKHAEDTWEMSSPTVSYSPERRHSHRERDIASTVGHCCSYRKIKKMVVMMASWKWCKEICLLGVGVRGVPCFRDENRGDDGSAVEIQVQL
mmetsp:Transcript_7955/g.14630  ORF Transcript_7955/g.14630 Transcript_7955/m.14630 type:complete len:111 (+) Transcript_7955:777-1109(+)